MTQTFIITETVPAHLCVQYGYPDPDTDPVGWIDAIRSNVAYQVQEFGRDLDWASDMVRIAKARADYEPPAPIGDIAMEILEHLAA